MFLKILFLIICNIESNCRIIFVKYFSTFNFWWIIDSFSLTTDKRFNIWNSFETPLSFCEIECNRYLVLKKVFFFRIYCYFFVFHLFKRIYIWLTTFKIYFVTFVIQQKDWIKKPHQFLSLMFLNQFGILKDVTPKVYQ